MKKQTAFLLEEETIKKITFLSMEKNMSYSNYINSLVEKDWSENISSLPFAEQIVDEVKKENLK